MAFFKRIEVWALLFLSLAGTIWVLWSEREQHRAEKSPLSEPATEPAGPEPGRFHIVGRRVSRESGHLILTIDVGRMPHATGGQEMEFRADQARLLTDAGESVPAFFVPFDPQPILGADADARARLRYWMPAAQATSGLWLQIDGERLAVKDPGATPAGNEPFPEGIEIALEGPDWRAAH